MKMVKTQIYDRLVRKKRRYERSPSSIYDETLSSQYWDRKEIEAWQYEKFNSLCSEAISGTNYFKDLLEKDNIDFSSLESLLITFPKLSKEIIIAESGRLLNGDKTEAFKHSTSGSTGKPLSVYVSNLAESYRKARLHRFLSWWGVDVYDRHVLIVGAGNSSHSTFNEFKNWMRNRKIINVLDLNDQTAFKYFEQIESFRPKYIRGYASGVLQLCRLMEKQNLRFSTDFLKVVIVTAEMLMEEDRVFMEEILHCRIANEYGAAEFGIIGNECPEGSMHINEESIWLGTDEANNAIITDLFNTAMPLLCYMNEDRIVLSDRRCSCGRTLKIIEKVEGRANSFVKCPDGSEKNMYVFHKIVSGSREVMNDNLVQQFKVIQKGFNFEFQIIPKKGYDEKISNYITDQMYIEIGEGISVEIKLVDHIAREKSGKLKFFEVKS